MAAWITPDDLLQALADFLGKEAGDLDARFARLCSLAAPQAQADLIAALEKVGYKDAGVLDGWDAKVQYCTLQGLYRVGILAAGLADYSLKGLETLDMRPTIKDGIAVMVGGSPIAPSLGDSPLGYAVGLTAGGQALADALRPGGPEPWDRCR